MVFKKKRKEKRIQLFYQHYFRERIRRVIHTGHTLQRQDSISFDFYQFWEQIMREFNSSPDLCNICSRGYELRKQRFNGNSLKAWQIAFLWKAFHLK